MKLWKNSTCLLLVVVCVLSLSATAMASMPDVALRDVQTHYWTEVSGEILEPITADTDDPWEFWLFCDSDGRYDAFNIARYDLESLTSKKAAHFLLYDNGDLYLSTGQVSDIAGFSKIMSNVKEIGKVEVPLFKSREVVSSRFNDRANYKDAYLDEQVVTTEITTILDENGNLYLMGCPTELAEENVSLRNYEYDVPFYITDTMDDDAVWRIMQYQQFRLTVTIEKLFPFTYQSDLTATPKVSDGIERIVPGYEFNIPFSWSSFITGYYVNDTQRSTSKGYKGFYIDKQGNSYYGFPTQKDSAQLANENVINYSPFYKVQMLEDQSIFCNGQRLEQDIKDIGWFSYLTNDGKLYDYDNKRIDSQVQFISDDGNFYIKEDDSLWSIDSKQKVMEDVATIFGNTYPVRSNGDVYSLNYNENNTLLPKKILEGNGFTPDPTPELHDGKVFKNASQWALIDLRAARNSGLTLPVKDLNYNTQITRERFAEIAVKLYEKLVGKTTSSSKENPFRDTNNSEIIKAYSLGIVTGTTATTFSPQDKITREAIATMLKRTVDLAGMQLPSGTSKQFADAKQIASWAQDSVSAMAAANVIKGTSADVFSPKANATIEQAVIMANRLLQ